MNGISKSTNCDPVPTAALGLLWRTLRRNALGVVASSGLLTVWQLSEALVPVVVGQFIDHAVVTGSVFALTWWGLVLVLVFASLILTFRHGATIAYRVDQLEAHRIRIEVADHLLRPEGARTGMLPGAAVSVATNDAEGVGTLAQSTANTVSAFLVVGASAILLLQIDVPTGLTVLLGVPLILTATQFTTPMIARRSRAQRDQIATASAVSADLVEGLQVIKGIGAEDEAAARYRTWSQTAKGAGIRVAASKALQTALSTGLSGLFLAVVTLLAGARALDGSITIGQLIAIVGLTQFYAAPIQALGQVGSLIAESHAAAGRIVDLLSTPTLVLAGDNPESPKAHDITMNQVTVDGLFEFSLTSPQGEMLCLAIDDPTTTRTLMRLLASELSPDGFAGEVRLGGSRLEQLTIGARNDYLLVNPHHADLFQGTLRSNIDTKCQHDDLKLERFLSAAAALEILRSNEGGLDQPVTAKGDTFSGGQRQRLALARALAADPPILVLDNPSTSVDAVTEQQIVEGISSLRHSTSKRTTWIITTSPVILARADRVVYVSHGRATAIGTHSELLNHPQYAELVLR